MMTDYFAFTISENLGSNRIDKGEVPIFIRGVNNIGCCIDKIFVQIFSFFESLFRKPSFGQILNKTMNIFHGSIRVQVSGKAEIAIPSFQDQTFDLPPGVETESEHTAPIGASGAYLAPCGCGLRNKYVATIMAIKNEISGKNLLLGKGKIKLGRF